MHNAKFLKVVGHDGLVRDTSNGAIINTNTTEYEDYIRRKQTVLDRENQIDQQSVEINNIKNELSEIKNMIYQLLTNK